MGGGAATQTHDASDSQPLNSEEQQKGEVSQESTPTLVRLRPTSLTNKEMFVAELVALVMGSP